MKLVALICGRHGSRHRNDGGSVLENEWLCQSGIFSVSAYSNKESGKRAFKTSEVVKIAQRLKVNKINDLF